MLAVWLDRDVGTEFQEDLLLRRRSANKCCCHHLCRAFLERSQRRIHGVRQGSGFSLGVLQSAVGISVV